MLEREKTLLVVVDVQERLLPAMSDPERVLDRAARAARGCAVLGVPALVTEQVPSALGRTVEALREALDLYEPIEKDSFSCCGERAFTEAVDRIDPADVLLCGIESHVCVLQTARALIQSCRRVHVLSDAVDSRDPENRAVALRRMERDGAIPSSVEIALFEMLKGASAPEFRSIVKIVK